MPEGGSETYTVKLSTQPSGDVTVAITGEANGLSVSPDALTFTTTNWSAAQTVTVSAAEDDNTDNETATLTHSSSGGGYDNTPDVEVTATSEDDDAVAGMVVDSTTVTVPEGGTNSYTVKLGSEPTGSVTVGITGEANGLTVSPDELTFSTTNWSTAQTVTVSAAEDDNRDNESATLTHSASGGGYDNVPDIEVIARSSDNDTTILVSPASVTVPEGGTANYGVSLSHYPSGDVTVTIAGAADGITASPSTLTFTTGNWADWQSVTVSAAQDGNSDNETITLTHSASGGGYDNVPDVEVTATSQDDDTAGLVVDATAVTVLEGDSATYTVKLMTQPAGAVKVGITGAADGLTVSPDTLTFSTTNWSSAQKVTVYAAEDSDMDSETATFTHSASGGGYDDAPDVEVTATSQDNDAAGLVLRRNGNPTGGIPVPEGGSNTYTVELTTEPTGTVTVTIEKGPPPPPGDWVSWSPQTLTFETTDWDTPQEVTVEAADDDMISDYVVLVHTASGGGYSATKNLTATQQDYDRPHLVVSRAELEVGEGSSATYTIRPAIKPLPNYQWGDVVVTISGGGNGLSASPAQLTFDHLNFRTAQTVTVSAAEDDNDAHETAEFRHTSSGGGYNNAPALVVTATAEDNDEDGGDDDELGGDPLPAPRLPDEPPRSGLDYIELRWPEVPGATHYQARLRPWGSEGWTSWSDPFLARPNTAFEELPPGLHVEIGVRACRAAKASACGKVALTQAATEPHGPGGVMLVARTPVSAVVAWAPNFRNTHAVFEFGRSRDMSAAAPDEVTGRAQPQSGSYTFGGLEAGVRYRFFARAAVLHGGPGIPELPPLSASRWEVAGPPGQGDGARGSTARDGTGVRLRGMGPGPRGEPGRRFTSLEGLKETLVDTVVVAGGGGAATWTAAAAAVAQPWLILEKQEPGPNGEHGPGGLLVRRRTVDGLEAGVYVTTVFLHMDGRVEPSAMLVDTLVIGRSVTEEEAAAALLGGQPLGEVQAGVLDRLGNGDGSYDLGDALSWIARCRRGGAECGGAGPAPSRESPLPDASAATPPAPPATAAGRASRRRRGRALRTRAGRRNRGPVRHALPRGRAQGMGPGGSSTGGSRRVGGARRTRFRRCLAPGLLFAALAVFWGCGDAGQVAEPALPPAEPERPVLTLRIESPGARVDAGVLVVIEGPGIDSLRAAPGYELVASDADADGGRWRVIVAGAVASGPLLELWTPSPGLDDGLYRATVVQAAGHDYARRNPEEYETALVR